MENVELIKDLCKREAESGCYDIYLEGFPIYRLVRHHVRNQAEVNCGLNTMKLKNKKEKVKLIESILISFFQLLKILLLKKKYENVFIAFPRIDKVNGIYLDKFTDPVIEIASISDYVIFDHGRAGVHMKPRIHERNIVYSDFIHLVSGVYARIAKNRIYKKHRAEFLQLKGAIDYIVSSEWEIDKTFEKVVEAMACSKIYAYIFKRIGSKRIMGPARNHLLPMIVAAHRIGVDAYEFQHGVTFSESECYSGRESPEVEPDVFFAFGDNKPNDVYGISPTKIVNIGWAFSEYLENNANIRKYGEKDVLVISDPEITDQMLEVVLGLAKQYTDSVFYFRPHPQEELSNDQLMKLESLPNVYLQNRNINIMEVLYGFNHVIGESSTVLYEALSIGRKVGRVFMNGLNPMYLQIEDKYCFWEIHNGKDFDKFLKEDVSTKMSKSIYSRFNKGIFNSFLN